MKDISGNQVRSGDVLIECQGGGMGSYFFRIWEMPKNYDGEGIVYGLDGSRHDAAWYNVNKSFKVPEVDELSEFFYSFRHGMGDFDVPEGIVRVSKTALEIIRASNWKDKIISREDVESYMQLQNLKLESIDDVITNLNLLDSKYVPHAAQFRVIELFGGQGTHVINGELGMAMFNDMLNYSYIIHFLKENNP